MLPYQIERLAPLEFRNFGRRLSPVGLSVREHLTSELLRFL